MRILIVDDDEIALELLGEALSGAFGADVHVAVARGLLGQANDVDEPADGAMRERERREFETGDVKISEECIVAFGGGSAKGKYLRDAAQLHPAQGAGDFREAVVVARFGVVEPIGSAAALITQTAQARGMCRILSEHGAAFTGGELLIGVEAEDGKVAKAAYA